MFRHSTKQHNKSQHWLRETSIRALNNSTRHEPGSVYFQTYNESLTKSSLNIVNQAVAALTSNKSEVNADARVYHTIYIWEHKSNVRIRCFFLQPEVVTAMAHTASSNYNALRLARNDVLKTYPAAEEGRLMLLQCKSQIQGRITPYVIDAAGLENSVTWSHCNISKSRIMFSLTTERSHDLLVLTRQSIDLLAAHSPGQCAIVYSEATKGFKLTVSPEASDSSENANKNSCILLYSDGTFKILGKVSYVHALCVALRQSILAISRTQLWESFISTLSSP